MVYVLNENGEPLMPTNNNAKVRLLLKNKKAKIVKKCPFTIQLLYATTNYTQPISLGVDTGSKHIGLSATTKKKVLYEADVELRNDIVNLMSSRKQNRKGRRYRKTRYRKMRYDNRKFSQNWYAPSIRNKINTHLAVIDNVYSILPISNINIEIAKFDIMKILNPQIEGIDYQYGEQHGFYNTREYVLFRDNHTCQCCKGKSKDKILNVHHIKSRKIGSNAPSNLITLCKTCHDKYHKGEIDLSNIKKRGTPIKDSAHMNLMRNCLVKHIKEKYQNVHITFGYITKGIRILNNLPKEHYIDARCISGNPNAISNDIVYLQKKVRCHNRQLHKNTILKGGIRKKNQAPFLVKGFRLFDTVSFENNEYIIFGRRSKGFFDIRTIDGKKVNNGAISYKRLRFIHHNNGMIIAPMRV